MEFRIVYNTKAQPGDDAHYENCRTLVDAARDLGVIDQESHEELTGRLTHFRNIAIIEARNKVTHKVDQDLIDPDFLR